MATNAKSKATTKKRTATKKSNSTKPSTKNNPSTSRSIAPKKSTGAKKSVSSNKNTSQVSHKIDYAEVLFWITIGVSAFIFVSNFGLCGKYGKEVSSLVMSLFGIVGYFIPFILIFAVAICLKKIRDVKALSKFICALILLVLISTLIELLFGEGGTVGSILVSLLKPRIGFFGTLIAVLIMMIIDYIFIFETSAVNDMKKAGSKGKKAYKQGREAYSQAKTKIIETVETVQSDPERPLKRRDRKATNKGLTFQIGLENTPAEEVPVETQKDSADLPVISQEELFQTTYTLEDAPHSQKSDMIEAQDIPFVSDSHAVLPSKEETAAIADALDLTSETNGSVKKKKNTKKTKEEIAKEAEAVEASIAADAMRAEEKPLIEVDERTVEQMKLRILPPLDCLKKGSKKKASNAGSSIDEMKRELLNTLQTFGVELHPDNGNDIEVTPGPSVTRFEFRPAPGVKVAKILSLQDDIKLSLAVEDIRIEAPIPGKAAVGIEVPNKEKTSVLLRDLLDTPEFQNSKSKVTYAVGKDIGGNTIISDIAKMPHLLIAGATGSGKSVFINTLIMSILYKATPDEVKFIMIDPKVVELSVYNNLPHLLIPVVTDPKKAAGALNWAVAEMTKRYQAFAREGVRDIKSFNAKCILPVENPEDTKLEKMTQIVVIVDELADLMMVAPKDVEEAICRLAQLARAAGIHLVLATQRPSVNVITGLIKANMPSRIALSVTSGIDSRTIIDMNGAEKLLGNGDMLFYPTGYTKPVRIQGAYVSDEEIQRVVSYIKEHNEVGTSSQEITEAIENHTIGGNITVAIGNSDNNERDSYFAEAGRLIIDKDKASIGMLQRQFKIGFNRAARIMDQLHEAGIVGPEEGTKPRKILMNASEFEQYLLDN